eukprot:m.335637 g.335637  ORF g.335637 m.335637 type:complete len:533 (+) comp19794_c0_seq17:255-1853(+)
MPGTPKLLTRSASVGTSKRTSASKNGRGRPPPSSSGSSPSCSARPSSASHTVTGRKTSSTAPGLRSRPASSAATAAKKAHSPRPAKRTSTSPITVTHHPAITTTRRTIASRSNGTKKNDNDKPAAKTSRSDPPSVLIDDSDSSEEALSKEATPPPPTSLPAAPAETTSPGSPEPSPAPSASDREADPPVSPSLDIPTAVAASRLTSPSTGNLGLRQSPSSPALLLSPAPQSTGSSPGSTPPRRVLFRRHSSDEGANRTHAAAAAAAVAAAAASRSRQLPATPITSSDPTRALSAEQTAAAPAVIAMTVSVLSSDGASTLSKTKAAQSIESLCTGMTEEASVNRQQAADKGAAKALVDCLRLKGSTALQTRAGFAIGKLLWGTRGTDIPEAVVNADALAVATQVMEATDDDELRIACLRTLNGVAANDFKFHPQAISTSLPAVLRLLSSDCSHQFRGVATGFVGSTCWAVLLQGTVKGSHSTQSHQHETSTLLTFCPMQHLYHATPRHSHHAPVSTCHTLSQTPPFCCVVLFL